MYCNLQRNILQRNCQFKNIFKSILLSINSCVTKLHSLGTSALLFNILDQQIKDKWTEHPLASVIKNKPSVWRETCVDVLFMQL